MKHLRLKKTLISLEGIRKVSVGHGSSGWFLQTTYDDGTEIETGSYFSESEAYEDYEKICDTLDPQKPEFIPKNSKQI